MALRFLIVGAGFSGAVLANRLVKQLDCDIDIWDERHHIGGNCYTERDDETGIIVHKYGCHIFNTDSKEIWDYMNSFAEMKPYVHKVKAVSKGKIYSFPINLQTLNEVFGNSFTPGSAKRYVNGISLPTKEPKNFREQALHMIGSKLYQTFFYGYTKKQWGCEPELLPASILKRIPIRFTYDDNYHNDIYTGIPINGYTDIIEKMIDHKNIKVTLNKKFKGGADVSGYDHVFYTGAIDAFFDYIYGRLGYRTVTFEKFIDKGDYQGIAQMNYCDEHTPFTRVIEFKHFTKWEQHDKTIYFKEYSKETTENDTPFYPKCLKEDKEKLIRYRFFAEHLSNISFLGRLATYRYMDMQHVIKEALDYSDKFVKSVKEKTKIYPFPNNL